MPSLPNADVRHLLSSRVYGGPTAVMRGAEYAQAMSTLLLRKSVDDERVGEPYFCANPNEMARIPGLLTLEERMPWVLSAHETAKRVVHGQWKIYRGRELVGYLVVLSNE
jgi:hypothetical protein